MQTSKEEEHCLCDPFFTSGKGGGRSTSSKFRVKFRHYRITEYGTTDQACCWGVRKVDCIDGYLTDSVLVRKLSIRTRAKQGQRCCGQQHEVRKRRYKIVAVLRTLESCSKHPLSLRSRQYILMTNSEQLSKDLTA